MSVRDSITRVDRYTAIALDYSGCFDCARVETFDSAKPVFTVKVKQFDLEAVQKEMQDDSVSVYLPTFLKSLRKIDALIEKARMSGVYSVPNN